MILELIISTISTIFCLVSFFKVGRHKQFLGFEEGFFSGVMTFEEFGNKKVTLTSYSDIVRITYHVTNPKISFSMRTFSDKIIIETDDGQNIVEDTPELIDCARFLMNKVPEKCDQSVKRYVNDMNKKTPES